MNGAPAGPAGTAAGAAAAAVPRGRGRGKDFRHAKDPSRPRSFKEDRRMLEPKKGGAGGKGTWGKPGDEINPTNYYIDAKDPNFPEGEEDDGIYFEKYEPELSPEEIQKEVGALVEEYFDHGDADEVFESLQRLNIGERKAPLIQLFLNLGLERHDEERELISVLIAEGTNNDAFGPEDVSEAFLTVLKGISDLSIDVPEAPKQIAKFMARAIADRALHHSILEQTNFPSEQYKEAISHARVLLSINGGFELNTVWVISGGLRPVKVLSEKISSLLVEYFSSSEKAEAERCLRDLAVPHFHHELVYTLIQLAAERKERELNLALELLKYLHNSSLLTVEQLGSGFERAFSDAADISLDIPNFHEFLNRFVAKSLEMGIISKALADEVPTKGRKRYLSQGDGGLLKN